MSSWGFLDAAPKSIVVNILLGGDRLSCVDVVIGCVVDGHVVGVATIASRGEENSGVPTLVALYVLPSERRKGYGQRIKEGAIQYCRKQGFKKLRCDVLSARVVRINGKLTASDRALLEIRDGGGFLDTLADQEL